MPHEVRIYPGTVYPQEAMSECPEAEAALDVLIGAMREQGPAPAGYQLKTLGKKKGQLWQINLKCDGRQVRILYAPYKTDIVLFRIHKKGSAAEQQRAYELAMDRKREYEAKLAEIEKAQKKGQPNVGNRTVH